MVYDRARVSVIVCLSVRCLLFVWVVFPQGVLCDHHGKVESSELHYRTVSDQPRIGLV